MVQRPPRNKNFGILVALSTCSITSTKVWVIIGPRIHNRKIVFLLTESLKENKNCSWIFGEHVAAIFFMVDGVCVVHAHNEWHQPTHIPLKKAARCLPKIQEQFLFSFPHSVSRKTIFLVQKYWPSPWLSQLTGHRNTTSGNRGNGGAQGFFLNTDVVNFICRPGGELKPNEDQVEGLKRLLSEVCFFC